MLPGAGLVSRPVMLRLPGFSAGMRISRLRAVPLRTILLSDREALFPDGLRWHPRGGGGRIAMSLKHFEVTFSFAGIVQVQAEDETDAIRQIQEKAGDFLMTRLDPEKLMIHSADEVDVGGQS